MKIDHRGHSAIIRGTYCPVIVDGKLLVVSPLFTNAKMNLIEDAVDLLFYCKEQPGTMCTLFGWTLDEVEKANHGLEELLRQWLPTSAFDNPKPEVSFGAFPPNMVDTSENND